MLVTIFTVRREDLPGMIFFKLKDKNLSIVQFIKELQKKYNEYNGIIEK